jgi:hypothetical protein
MNGHKPLRKSGRIAASGRYLFVEKTAEIWAANFGKPDYVLTFVA